MNYDNHLREVCRVENVRIRDESLAKLSWGNYSCIDRSNGLVYIKPSGVDPSKIEDSDIAVVALNGKQVAGLKKSVDTDIHLSIYRSLVRVSSICHTHSTYATSFAQARRSIQQYGTTHCDVFPSEVRVIDPPPYIYALGKEHEKELGKFISESLTEDDFGAILVAHHGPFVWSQDLQAIDIAVALEEIAKMSFITEQLGSKKKVPVEVSRFHWSRKHGKESWYGQDGN